MTYSHPTTPIVAADTDFERRLCESDYQRTFGAPAQPPSLPVNNGGPLTKAHQLEAKDSHSPNPRRWKEKFKVGQRMEIHGHCFVLAHISKRGLIYHRVKI